MNVNEVLSETVKIYCNLNELTMPKIGEKALVKSFTHRNQNLPLSKYINLITQKQSPSFKTTFQRDTYYRTLCETIKVPPEYMHAWEQYKFIEAQPQPEQRTPLWYEMRNNFITASSGAQAIGESKYDPPEEMIKGKLGVGKPFIQNKHVHHGKKLETIATRLYEHIYNVYVGEFGLIPHPNISFLGASPDGICAPITLDNKFSPLVGRMVEIKCVTTRKINTSGPEHMLVMDKATKDKGIVPHYYWVQCQLQLECCDLEECDFWQCKIEHHENMDELRRAIEVKSTRHTVGQDEEIKIDPRLEYGVLIELLPKEQELLPGEELKFFGEYIYPDNLLLTLKEKEKWAKTMEKNWKKRYPQFVQDYDFHKVLYYHIPQTHCYLVKRDREWFKNNHDKFKAFWDRVIYYRNNPDNIKELFPEPEPSAEYEWMSFDSDSD
jgi:putative phage-type endonuclease